MHPEIDQMVFFNSTALFEHIILTPCFIDWIDSRWIQVERVGYWRSKGN